MSVPLKALRSIPYAGRRVKAGQPFDARTRSDARLLIAIGHAEKREPDPRAIEPAKPAQYRTRVMTAEQPEPAPQSPPLVTKTDGLDDMDAEALRAMAERMGLHVHHRAGAYTIRRAIRTAKAAEE